MASVIIKELGVDQLIEDVGNPIAFCREYVDAARRSGTDAPVFSTSTLHDMESLESKYAMNKDN